MSKHYEMRLNSENEKEASDIFALLKTTISDYSFEEIKNMNMTDDEKAEFFKEEATSLDIDFWRNLDINGTEISIWLDPDWDYVESFTSGYSYYFLMDIVNMYPSYNFSFNSLFSELISGSSISEYFNVRDNKFLYICSVENPDCYENKVNVQVSKTLGVYENKKWNTKFKETRTSFIPGKDECLDISDEYEEEFYGKDYDLSSLYDQNFDDEENEYDNDEDIIETAVVGTKFDNRIDAHEIVSIGDKVILKREPDNRYDSNAIEVFTLDEKSLGYIPADLASDLAYRLDEKLITIKNAIVSYSLPLSKQDKNAKSPLMDIEIELEVNENFDE